MPQPTGTLRRFLLSKRVKQLREAAGLSATQVEKDLEWPKSKLTRIENNQWSLPRWKEIAELLTRLGVENEEIKETLVDWAKHGRQKDWWNEYKISDQYGLYISMEAEAQSLKTFQNSRIPGLLQTEAYARALIGGAVQMLSPEEVEARVQIRLARQKILEGDDPLELEVVLDESVLRRPIGGRNVHAEQMEHLAKMAEQSNVQIYTLPFDSEDCAAPHSYSIIEFPDELMGNAVYIETLAGELFLEKPELVRIYETAFRRDLGSSTDPKASRARLTDIKSV